MTWSLHNMCFLFVIGFLRVSYIPWCTIHCRDLSWRWTSHGMCILEQSSSVMAGLFLSNNLREYVVLLCIWVLLRYFQKIVIMSNLGCGCRLVQICGTTTLFSCNVFRNNCYLLTLRVLQGTKLVCTMDMTYIHPIDQVHL